MYCKEYIKQLRDKTGAGVIDCKKALVVCDNDINKAENYLKEYLGIRRWISSIPIKDDKEK